MITYPYNWNMDYEKFAHTFGNTKFSKEYFVRSLKNILSKINVPHLAYSGGIDSTVMLSVMTNVYGYVNTYTISCRDNHPDIVFARNGSKFYKTKHHEFVVKPNRSKADKFPGDNAVRQLFENTNKYTNKLVCCDGIDEFMCGYYDHQNMSKDTYKYYLSRLLPDHLVPLHNTSKSMKVYLPYLDNDLIDIYTDIPLDAKVDKKNRKKVMLSIAKYLKIPEDIIYRNKYGFCDAFKEDDK